MVSVEEASNIIFSNLVSADTEDIPVFHAINRVLAEPIVADRDFPPFPRVSMDGIAIAYESWQKGARQFKVETIQAAGAPQQRLQHPQHCIEVMTGAVLPAGTDTVIRYEDLQLDNGHATVRENHIVKGQNIHPQAQDARKNEVLLDPGLVISPAEVALLASVGKSKVNVYAFPKTAIISTGDELVDIDETPDAYQIRKSNTYALEAAMQQMTWSCRQFHLPDQKEFLEQALRVIAAEHDVLILSGGVSKGKFDFVPDVLEEIGIKKLFHQVRQRPGKPFWFGRSAHGKTVFALPGNPVSTYMCFYRYVKPWMMKSMGADGLKCQAVLGEDFSFDAPLTYFLQVRISIDQGRLVAFPRAGGGSGDFANLKKVSGFLELPSHQNTFKKGEVYPFISFRPLL